MEKQRISIYYIAAFGILALYCVLKSINAAPYVFGWRLGDIDDVGRVLEVRAWLEGQGFYDLANHRSNPPFGGDMHWSRIADIPLAITQLVFRLFMDNQSAEKISVLITPQWLLLIYAFVSLKLVLRLCNNYIAIIVFTILTIVCDVMQSNFYPGRVDHHGLQLILLILCLYGVTFSDFKHSFVSGTSLAIGMAIGFELIPIQIVIVGYITLLWLINGDKLKLQIQGFAIGFGLFISIGLLIDVDPIKIMEGANDRLSIATAAPVLVGCFGLYFASLISNSNIKIRAISLAIIACLVCICIGQFPILFNRLYWQIDPKYYHLWMDDCADCSALVSKPFFIQMKYGYFIFAVTVAIMIKMFLLIKKIKKDNNLSIWLLLTLLMVENFAMTFFFQARIMGQASAIAIIIASAIIAETFILTSTIRACLVAIALFPSWGNLYQAFSQKIIPQKSAAISYTNSFKCHSTQDFAHIAAMPKGLAAVNLNLGPELLINSHHNVLATGFHRDLGRNLDYPIFLAKDDDAKAKIKALGVNYIVYCSVSLEPQRIKEAAPDGLMAHLLAGKVPEYLRLIPAKNDTDVIAYEVVN